jgi:DNA-binding MarR family transcriptional regulator
MSGSIGEKYGGNKGRQANKEFMTKALLWIAKFKFSSPEVIAVLFSIKSSTGTKKLQTLRKKGLIKEVKTISTKSSRVFILTREGKGFIQRDLCIDNLTIWTDSYKVTNRFKNTHDLAVQIFIAEQYSRGNIKFVMSEFDLKDLPPQKIKLRDGKEKVLTHFPDAIVTHWEKDENKESDYYGKWAVEFESMRKSSTRVEELVKFHYACCCEEGSQSLYWGVHYVFLKKADRDFYSKIIGRLAHRTFPQSIDSASGEDINLKARENFYSCFQLIVLPSAFTKMLYEIKYENWLF